MFLLITYNLCARNFKTLDYRLGSIASPLPLPMITSIPKTHTPTGILLNAFKHSWEPVVSLNPEYTKSTLPPPFEAFGEDTFWKLHSCEIKHEGNCYDFTLLQAKGAHEKNGRILKQFNVLFGVTRNKKFAAELRALKKIEKEEEEKEEEEESSESESSESEESSASEESESEQDDDEDDDETEEEPEKK